MTVFGPGIGESVVLHLGNNDWMVIDSCLTPGTDEPIALDYLRSIGINPAACVRRVLATHWHDDHIRGIAKILDECPTAEFAMSTALAPQQFLQIVLEVREQNKFVKQTSTAHEFADILEILEKRANAIQGRAPRIFAHDGTRIFQGGHQNQVDVWALSPSAASIANAQVDLADQLLVSATTRMFKQFTPNDLSVAVLVDAKNCSLLLGADLEHTARQEFGWTALLNSTLCPQLQSHGFKVAHHGSENGDHDGIWSTKLISNPYAIVTPYLKLRDALPKNTDVDRLKSRSQNVFCTTWPPSRQPPRRRGADALMNSATAARRAMNTNLGFVRLRADLSANPTNPSVRVFGSATKL
jgi:beta-lactamase superfamily II metal-dependent hydrolase